MTRQPYHPVRVTRPRPVRVPRSAPSGGKNSGGGCGMVAIPIAAGLVLGTALIMTPLGVKVATQQIIPAADRYHYADGLLALAVVAGLLLYVFVSLLQTRRTTTAAAVTRLAAADGASTPGASNHPVAPARRPTRESVGRRVTPTRRAA